MSPTPSTTALAHTLLARGLTIAVAESLTGGLLCAELASVPGVSGALAGGIVAYQTPLKAALLGVATKHLDTHGAVHDGTAAAMASGVRMALPMGGKPADIGVSTTGVAGPSRQDGHPPGTVFVGIDGPYGARVITLDLAAAAEGDPVVGRNAVRRGTVDAAINALIVYLENEGKGEAARG